MRERRFDYLKRAADITVAALGLTATAPIQVVIALIVRAQLGSPVFFQQVRPGKDAQDFTLVKFRTMLEPMANGDPTTDAERLVPLGHLLRSTSLDDLPTLWNVLRGDMSLVGPRPFASTTYRITLGSKLDDTQSGPASPASLKYLDETDYHGMNVSDSTFTMSTTGQYGWTYIY